MLTVNTMLTIKNNGSKRFVMSHPQWGKNALSMVTGLPAYTVDPREMKYIPVVHNKLPW